MSAREAHGRDTHGARGRVAAPTRHIPENPDVLTLRDIPKIIKPGGQQVSAKPHFATPKQQQFAPKPSQQPNPTPHRTTSITESAVDPALLAKQRSALGFDDIPIVSAEELENGKDRRKKASSWAREAYTRGMSADNRHRLTRFVKEKEFLRWKDDLKWALRADRSDDTDASDKPQPPMNVVADPQPRQVRVPQRGTQFAAGLRAQSRLRQQSPQQMAPAAAVGNKSIDINISFGSLPKLPKLPKLPDVRPLISDLRHLKWNRRTQITAGVLVVLALFVLPHFLPTTMPTDSNGVTETTNNVDQKPAYNTLVPSSKATNQVSWKRVSPPGHNPVFAYADKIGNVAINVSQQPLPDGFKTNTNTNIAHLAKDYSATEKVTAGATTVYVGTSSDGPQSVIFTKNNLLILVKSTGKIADADWAKYVESLN